MGHVYQGRFKAFPIAEDDHLLTVMRYVERNPLQAGLVERAEDWPFGSLHRRLHPEIDDRPVLADCPVPMGPSWVERIDRPASEAELAAIRISVARGRPFGGAGWCEKVSRQSGLEHTLRSRGRARTLAGNSFAEVSV